MDISPICRIALVGQDAALASAIMATVQGAGYGCRHFIDGDTAAREMNRDRFDLLLIAGTRPQAAIARLMIAVHARSGFAVPVIGIGTENDIEAIAAALDLGMDHILAWPVAPRVLVAQLNAALRRAGPAGSPVDAAIGHLVFRREGMRVHVDGVPASVTTKEYALGLMLCRNLGQPLDRDRIFRAIWGDAVPLTTRTLDVHVSRLRTKLQLRPDRGFHLSALYGRGYRLDYDPEDMPAERRRPAGSLAGALTA